MRVNKIYKLKPPRTVSFSYFGDVKWFYVSSWRNSTVLPPINCKLNFLRAQVKEWAVLNAFLSQSEACRRSVGAIEEIERISVCAKKRKASVKRECGEISGEKRIKAEKMKSGVENKLFFVVLLVIVELVIEIFTRELEVGPCFLQYLEPCANNSIQFFLFTSESPEDEPTLLDNISPVLPLDVNETESKSFKMIIHGYGGHLDFNGSKQIRKGRKNHFEACFILIEFIVLQICCSLILESNKPASLAKLSSPTL